MKLTGNTGLGGIGNAVDNLIYDADGAASQAPQALLILAGNPVLSAGSVRGI